MVAFTRSFALLTAAAGIALLSAPASAAVATIESFHVAAGAVSVCAGGGCISSKSIVRKAPKKGKATAVLTSRFSTTLSFAVGSSSGASKGKSKSGGALGGSIIDADALAAFRRGVAVFPETPETAAELAFLAPGAADLLGARVDEIALARETLVNPLPAGLPLLLTGLIGLGGVAARRKKA